MLPLGWDAKLPLRHNSLLKQVFLSLEGISDHLDLDSRKEISLPASGNLLLTGQFVLSEMLRICSLLGLRLELEKADFTARALAVGGPSQNAFKTRASYAVAGCNYRAGAQQPLPAVFPLQ